MARPLRITYEGAVYHVTMRGNDRRNIFLSNGDREYFLSKLSESVRLYAVRLYLFCQMTNHVHLVLETPEGNLSRFMHRLQTAYTVYFNRRHRRSGHLLQGRFGSTLVDEDQYILKLSRYVHLNPVFVKANEKKPDRERVQILRDYLWSSYRSYIGRSKRLDFVDYGPILGLTDGPKKTQAACYRRFVEAGIRDIDAAFIQTKHRSRFCIGSDRSRDRARQMYGQLIESHGRREDISFRRDAGCHSVDEVLAAALDILHVRRDAIAHRSRKSMTRPIVAYALCRYAGCTQRAAAEAMGLSSGAAVSLQLKKLNEQLKSDRKLRSIMEKVRRRLA
ncbi:MAG: transposase [Planctomycetota bacterium]